MRQHTGAVLGRFLDQLNQGIYEQEWGFADAAQRIYIHSATNFGWVAVPAIEQAPLWSQQGVNAADPGTNEAAALANEDVRNPALQRVKQGPVHVEVRVCLFNMTKSPTTRPSSAPNYVRRQRSAPPLRPALTPALNSNFKPRP
eukprot:GHVU01141034.1.p1 GENE.GHVU01141034.1~~GHVU01141034.1.p1  ORF type:complete len:144 (-),score=12.39 GHVU01141034.1:919-1350(-)